MLGLKVHKALVNDVKAADAFLKSIAEHHTKSVITLTGHSLGGSVAQLLGSASGNSAFVFDAPGTKVLFDELAIPLGDFPLSRNRNYQNIDIRVVGDQVSLAGMPMGRTVTVQNPASLSLLDVSASAKATTCTSLLSTLEQLHSMDTMLAQVNHDTPTVDASQELNLVQALTDNLCAKTLTRSSRADLPPVARQVQRYALPYSRISSYGRA